MMKTKNKTRNLILGLLCESPLSGYEIKKIVDSRFSFFWSESFGQIYPVLEKMKEDGVILETESANTSGRRKIRKYEITPEGIAEMTFWLTEPVEKETVRYEILLKLFFSNLVSPEVMIEHIREFQRNHRKQQLLFDGFEKELTNTIHLHNNHPQVLMTLLFGQKVYKAYDEWCTEAIDLLRKIKPEQECAT